MTVVVLSVLLSLVLALSLSTCTVSAVVHAVMYKRLQRYKTKAAPKGEGPPTQEEAGQGEKMQANPAYLPIEMSYKSKESKYINVSSWSNERSVYTVHTYSYTNSVLIRFRGSSRKLCTYTMVLTGTCVYIGMFFEWWVANRFSVSAIYV